ncbi:hypothetical protein RIR_jg29786.t1 [Rhizophagus irregularis DAOM 181602=DAOM 197198]|nr:hypothetical protein RIR_jg29786.t1 [Rhizophagus irregularis DAOM 181602=DAOM 197198]
MNFISKWNQKCITIKIITLYLSPIFIIKLSESLYGLLINFFLLIKILKQKYYNSIPIGYPDRNSQLEKHVCIIFVINTK